MSSILVVEDNPADVLLLQTALAELRPEVRVHSVRDGAQALDFVYRRGSHSAAPIFDLILLDLNMPGIDGHHFLELLRADDEFRHVPVAVWTSSRDKSDVQRAYRHGANAYYRKRSDYTETLLLVRVLTQHWFDTAQLPG
jgi:two-component system response regulator